MASFVDVPDMGSDYLILMACQHRLASGDAASCIHQLERLERDSIFEGVRASAHEIIRQHRDQQEVEKIRPDKTSAETE
jgi:hypothetical protein